MLPHLLTKSPALLLLQEFVEPLGVPIELNNFPVEGDVTGSREATHHSDQCEHQQLNNIERKVAAEMSPE